MCVCVCVCVCAPQRTDSGLHLQSFFTRRNIIHWRTYSAWIRLAGRWANVALLRSVVASGLNISTCDRLDASLSRETSAHSAEWARITAGDVPWNVCSVARQRDWQRRCFLQSTCNAVYSSKNTLLELLPHSLFIWMSRLCTLAYVTPHRLCVVLSDSVWQELWRTKGLQVGIWMFFFFVN